MTYILKCSQWNYVHYVDFFNQKKMLPREMGILTTSPSRCRGIIPMTSEATQQTMAVAHKILPRVVRAAVYSLLLFQEKKPLTDYNGVE
jgi:hypothetical protein